MANGTESVVAESFDTVITSRSTIQERLVVSMRDNGRDRGWRDVVLPVLDHDGSISFARLQMSAPKLADTVMPLALLAGGSQVRDDLFVTWHSSNDSKYQSLRWWTVPDPNHPRKFSWLVVARSPMLSTGTIKIDTFRKTTHPEGFFVGQKIGTAPSLGIPDFHGCFRIANGIPYAHDANKGVSVTVMAHPGSGYHGWCYRYRDMPGWSKIRLHYFAASSAPTWTAVADWIWRAYTKVAGQPSKSLASIATNLKLDSSTLTAAQKVRAIQTWMTTHLKYSTAHSKAFIPNDFDSIVRNGGGDCKDLVLVLVELLKAAHINAHPAVTSMEDWWPFLENSANVDALDHVVVYLPGTGRYLDPTTDDGKDAMYLAGRQVLDVVTAKVLNVPKALAK